LDSFSRESRKIFFGLRGSMKAASLILFIFFVVTVSVLGEKSQKGVNLEKEKEELLKVHKIDREAHFKTDVELLLQHSAEEFISVNSGKISKSSRAEVKQMFEEYFRNAKYYQWDDLEVPIIKISNDATMAWMIVRIKVKRTQSLSNEEKERQFVYAGIMTYEKQNGKWVRIANVSTFE
jgi:hypothetical protein